MKIRPFTHDDIPQLIALGRRAHEESEYRGLVFDEDKCRALCEAAISSDAFIAMVAVTEETITGILLAAVADAYFSTDKTAGDLLVYVPPEHRGTRSFYMLAVAYVVQAREKGARLIFLRSSTGIETEKTESLYRRLGFKKMGGIYRMEA